MDGVPVILDVLPGEGTGFIRLHDDGELDGCILAADLGGESVVEGAASERGVLKGGGELKRAVAELGVVGGLINLHELVVESGVTVAGCDAKGGLAESGIDGAGVGEKFLGDAAFDPLLQYLGSRNAVVHVHPSLHPSSKALDLPWPGFMIEYPFDTTRAAVNLLFSGTLERFPSIRFILSHAGGTLPYLAWRLSVAPMIDKRLKQRTRDEIFAGLKTFWYDNALASGAAPMGALSHIAATDRIVFGSDWPFCNDHVVTEEVADFTAPDFLPPQTIAMIARENALKLFPNRAGQFT